MVKIDPYKGTPGFCFKNAFKFAELNPDWKIVHGIALGTAGEAKGKWYGHAWNEIYHAPLKLQLVYDPSAPKVQAMPAAIYYKVGSIEYTVTYTLDEARMLMLKQEHYGPWDQKIDDLVPEGDK